MKSKLFLRNITNVDHAYIDETGRVIGGSFHASAIVSGSIDDYEKVVIDFSTCKRDIKTIIDHRVDGFDHKLWVIDGVSCILEDRGREIETAACKLSSPSDMFKRFSASEYSEDAIAQVMSQEVTDKMRTLYPNTNVDVAIELSTQSFSTVDYPLMFRYSHGLKNSSSVGCRRLAHGHLSFIEFVNMSRISSQTMLIRSDIRSRIDNAVFLWRENIQSVDNDWVHIQYLACDGNEYRASYRKSMNNLIILDTETTVEYLAEYVKREFGQQLTELGCTGVFISEGLQKGAVVDL